MFIEGLLFVGVAGWAYSAIRTARDEAKDARLPMLPTVAESPSDTTRLVVELLRSDKGWQQNKVPGSNYTNHIEWEHNTGVRIRLTDFYDGFTDHSSVTISVLNLENVYEAATTKASDARLIRSELTAFGTRKHDSKQRALTRLLAERIVAAENGEVLPVLGSGGVSESSTSNRNLLEDKRTVDTPDATGFLVYDAQKRQVVQLGYPNPKRLEMSDELEDRYGLRPRRPSVQRFFK